MKHLNFYQRWKLPIEELEQYYIKVREERFNNDTFFRGLKFRKVLHPVLLCGLYVMHILNKQKITIVGDKRIKTKKPIIYAATHIGWDDIEMILTAVKDQAYLFWGDPRESYRELEGFLLDLNGYSGYDNDIKRISEMLTKTNVHTLCYVDNEQSFSCNEITIYWNSPLIYLMTGLLY